MSAAVRVVLVLGAFCALVFPVGAASVATPPTFRFTTPVPLVFVQSTPHASFFFTEAIETAVPRIGRATVEVDFSTCSPIPCEPTGSASMRARITAPGGTLVLSGGSSSHDELSNTGTWTVTESTGRFEGYTGAGTYTWRWTTTPFPFGAATLTLMGHLGTA
jgi:hypothetical protein